jgi:hypothetical protein
MGFSYTINYIQAEQVATSILNIHLDENPKVCLNECFK